MSSPPPEGSRRSWPRWRVTMLAGSLLLLGVAVANAVIERGLPRELYLALFVTSYAVLGYGFFLALSARRKASERRNND